MSNMAKKKKNIGHKNATKRINAAKEEAATFGLDLSADRVMIGLLFNHLALSHLTYMGLNYINVICKKYSCIDLCVFSQHIISPCVNMLCPIFEVKDIYKWDNHPLISTSIDTTITALSTNASKIYHYSFDPEFIDKAHKESGDILPAFCDDRVMVVTRHRSHADLIESEFGIKVCDTIVEDCNVEELIKLILTEMKNGE
jgi:hypothetical protein